VVLSRGEHPVAAAVTLSRDLSIVGGATALVLARGGPGLVVTAPARVALTAISLRYPPGRSAEGDVALAVRGGALWMRDVTLDDADVGLEAAGGTVDAERFTVRRSARYGVWGTANASLAVSDFVVRDGAGQGIRIEGAHVRLALGLVAGHARHGVVLLGDPDATGGVARCRDAAPGALDCIDQLVAQGNGVAALYVAGARRVEVRRSTLADTALATIEGGEAGDGLFVGPDADVSLDPELVTATVRGFGSALLGNGRVGLLAQGTRARVSVRGAVFARNAAGGVIIGNRAEAPVIGESVFVENRFGGIVATPGAAMGVVQCNGIADTLAGTLRGGHRHRAARRRGAHQRRERIDRAARQCDRALGGLRCAGERRRGGAAEQPRRRQSLRGGGLRRGHGDGRSLDHRGAGGGPGGGARARAGAVTVRRR
jgi:hypothetical protein